MAAGVRGILDFVMYGVGAVVPTPSISPVTGGTPLILDMQQAGLMELQSFFPLWGIAIHPHRIGSVIDIACGSLGDTLVIPGRIDDRSGPLFCCDD